jgi:hypothetical protein
LCGKRGYVTAVDPATSMLNYYLRFAGGRVNTAGLRTRLNEPRETTLQRVKQSPQRLNAFLIRLPPPQFFIELPDEGKIDPADLKAMRFAAAIADQLLVHRVFLHAPRIAGGV